MKTSGSFEVNNQAAVKHGLERSIKQLQRGEPLTGPAAEAEAIVRVELETEGVSEIVKTGAIRLEAMARAFYNKVCEALEQDNFAEADKFIKRYGWLQMGAGRYWAQYTSMQKSADDGSIEAAISSVRGNNNGNDSSIG